MADRTERAVLNHLIETCKDAERGFRHVASHAADPAIKGLFLDIAEQRARFAADLVPHAQRLGGSSGPDGSTAASLHRTWIDLRHALARNDQHDIVEEAQRGERFSMSVYQEALANVMHPDVRQVLEAQCAELRKTGERLQAMSH
jgi:uncharacterized protein (TIGR02284 family)